MEVLESGEKETKIEDMQESCSMLELEDGVKQPLCDVQKSLGLGVNKRFFQACKSCYELCPPIIIQLVNSQCGMCNGVDQETFLQETTRFQGDGTLVDYIVIRELKPGMQVEYCRNLLDMQLGSCPDGEGCISAHSCDEIETWTCFKSSEIEWKDFAKRLSNQTLSDETLRGCFHCPICSQNFENAIEFSQHRDSNQHKKISKTISDKNRSWKFRNPPNVQDQNIKLCSSVERGSECSNGENCLSAHSQLELDEWKERISLIQKKFKFAKDNELLSFSDQILQEYETSSSPATVLIEHMPGVSFKSSQQTCSRHCPPGGSTEWKITLKVLDIKNVLSHVAFLKQDRFTLCKVRGKRNGHYSTHIDYTLYADDNNSMVQGIAKYQVKFTSTADDLGDFSDTLVFEFDRHPRPALMVRFHVFVVPGNINLATQLAHNKPPPQCSSWVKTRPIVPFPMTASNDFERQMLDLALKYKAPEVALSYNSSEGQQFESARLDSRNYVEEMHKFLYREESARRDAISRLHCAASVGLSSNYYSNTNGLQFVVDSGTLFGIFELPNHLNRDTDEGVLVLENCVMVLVSLQGSDSDSPVYQAKMKEFSSDHAVLTFSKQCVEDWKLSSGMLIHCEIQFQLDRRIFCMSHRSLDALEDLGRLSILCPDAGDGMKRFQEQIIPLQAFSPKKELDPHQCQVMRHMMADDPPHPLFTVVGPFGTGKTYTIGKCVMYLLGELPKAKILICTHSNSAADLYIKNNFADEYWKGKIIRVLYCDRSIKSVPEDVRPHCLINETRTGFDYPTTKQILSKEIRVVVTTFATSLVLGLMGTGLDGVFTHIFLDEAAQAMEAEAVIPLAVASPKVKVIVAGDHMQISQKIYSDKFGCDADYTLVERMYSRYKTFPKKMQDQLYAFLTNNYRCVGPILEVIEEVFYKRGVLTCCSEEQILVHLNNWLQPVQFYHVEGNCVKDYSSGGYYNVEEVMMIVWLLGDILGKYPQLLQTDIVVVSSYAIQVRVIRDELRKNRMFAVNVDRVRNIQGREFKVVIMSCVHRRESASDDHGANSGLLADVGLLNTAITRSKVAVIAVGDAVTLLSLGKCHLRWNYYVKACCLNDSLLPRHVSLSMILHKVSQLSALNPQAVDFVPRNSAKVPNNAPGDPSNASGNNSVASGADATPEDMSSVGSPIDYDESEGSDSEEDHFPLVDDKILDDILEKQLGFRPEKMTISVDAGGLEYLEEIKNDPNEPETGRRRDDVMRDVIYQKFTVRQLRSFLQNKPRHYKHCVIHKKTWYAAEAVVTQQKDDDCGVIAIKSRKNMGISFDRDEVVVHVKRGKPGEGATGKVIGVLSRYKEPRNREFVCIPDPYSPSFFMCPVDNKTTKFAIVKPKNAKKNEVTIYSFHADGKENMKCKPERVERIDIHSYHRGGGKLFIVRYLKWSETSLYPLGYVSKVIKASEAEKYFAITYDVPPKHRKDVEEECEGFEDTNSDLRIDLTDLFVFTIDPPGSKDLDDALSITKCSQGHHDCFEVGIHIADVASMVPEDSKVDRAAQDRATTFYDPDILKDRRKNSPMLPKALSSRKCSLLADGKTRPAISTFFHTSMPPDITNPDSCIPPPKLTLIKSRRQMNYKEAEDCLRKARNHRHHNDHGDHEDHNDHGDHKDHGDDNDHGDHNDHGNHKGHGYHNDHRDHNDHGDHNDHEDDNDLEDDDDELDEITLKTLPQQMYQIWRFLLVLRQRRIGVSIYSSQTESNKFQHFYEEGLAHMMIEEAMITLNASTAIFLKNSKSNFLLICQEQPPKDLWRNWIQRYSRQINLSLHMQSCLQHLGAEVQDKTTIKNLPILPEVLGAIQDALNREDAELLLLLLSCDDLHPTLIPASSGYMRIQQRATLKPCSHNSNRPLDFSHFSLRIPLYSWCSSPIRRYTDVIAQRAIVARCRSAREQADVDGDVIVLGTRAEKNLTELCKVISLRHNDAKEYERDLMQFTVAKDFQQQENRLYIQAVVTEITDREIGFQCTGYKRLKKNVSVMNYSSLQNKVAKWGNVLERVDNLRNDKILETNHLKWFIRYYKLPSKSQHPNTNPPQHPHFNRSMLNSKLLQNLVSGVAFLLESGDRRNMLSEKTKADVSQQFKRIVKTKKSIGGCPGRLGAGPCDRGTCSLKDSPCNDHLAFTTKNGIRHVRVISMELEAGIPLLIQLAPMIKRGLLTPSVQLWCLRPDFDLCLTHQRDPVETFASDVRPAAVQNQYESVEKYARSWLPVLRLDGVFNAVRDGSSITFAGVPIHWEENQEMKTGWFELEKIFCNRRILHIHRDGFLCIRIKNVENCEGNLYTFVCHALVVQIDATKSKTIKVRFVSCPTVLPDSSTKSPARKDGSLATVEYVELLVPHRRMASALQTLNSQSAEHSDVIRMLCLNRVIPEPILHSIDEERFNDLSRSVGQQVWGFKTPLNQGQIIHVQLALRNKLTLIQGPPGTGKSFMGAYLVYYFQQLNKLKGNDKYILYCGPSNKSVDVVAEYLLHTGLRVLRVYGELMEELSYRNPLKPTVGRKLQERPPSSLHDITLHERIRMKSNRFSKQIRDFDTKFEDKKAAVSYEEYLEYKSIVNQAKLIELACNDVIICTCTSAAMKLLQPNPKSKIRRLVKMSFSHCIIDEAGMCSEPETLTPAISVNPEQLVLIGDHMQLQPVIQCKRSRELGLDVSMFERLKQHAGMLTNQYRMNPTICDFPSRMFYNGHLTTDLSVLQRERITPGVVNYPRSARPNSAIFAHIESEEDSSSNKLENADENSKFNREQARASVKILFWLHANKGIPLDRIMILSPYKAQCNEVNNIIKKERPQLAEVHVGTVTNSQGNERDYVILSTVRSQPEDSIEENPNIHWRRRYLGFIVDFHQVNVAITRAKSGLIIIGNKHLLSKDKTTWFHLLNSYEERGSVFDFKDANSPWYNPRH